MKKLLLSLVMLMPLIAFGATDVVFDFTTNGFKLPTSKDQNTTATGFSNDAGQSITTLNCYWISSGKAVLIQNVAGNYIKFAPFQAPVTKVTITSGKSCANAATVKLKANDTVIKYGKGDDAVEEVNLNAKGADFVWNVPADLQAAGTVYTIENANANNVQIGKVIFTIDANYVDLWLRGYKTWDATDENKLNTTDGVHYTRENVVLRTGSKFKIADATWGANNYGSASDVVAGQEYTLESGSGSGDITIAEEMVATVNFNLDTKVLSLTKTGDVPEPVITYAIHGALEDEWKDYPLTEDEGLWATVVKVTKEPNGEFGLKKYIDGSQAAWYGYNVDHTIDSSEELTLVTADTKNLKILPGKYKLSFKPDDATLAVELIPEVVLNTINDELKASMLAAENTTYADFSEVKATDGSKAVYAGNTAKNTNGAIQLRSTTSKNSDQHAGIISTTSGGHIRLVKVVWGEGNTLDRELDVYVSNEPFSNVNAMWATGDEKVGEKVGSIKYDGVTDEFVVEGNYKYVGLRSHDGALYFDSITLGWEETSDDPTAVASVAVETGVKIVYNLQGMRINNTENLPAGLYVINGKKVLVK